MRGRGDENGDENAQVAPSEGQMLLTRVAGQQQKRQETEAWRHDFEPWRRIGVKSGAT